MMITFGWFSAEVLGEKSEATATTAVAVNQVAGVVGQGFIILVTVLKNITAD
jgi:hypothetical protein